MHQSYKRLSWRGRRLIFWSCERFCFSWMRPDHWKSQVPAIPVLMVASVWQGCAFHFLFQLWIMCMSGIFSNLTLCPEDQIYPTGGLEKPFSGHFCQCSHLRRPKKQSGLLGFRLLWSFAFPSLSLFISLQEKFPGCLLALKLPLIRAQGIPHR